MKPETIMNHGKSAGCQRNSLPIGADYVSAVSGGMVCKAGFG